MDQTDGNSTRNVGRIPAGGLSPPQPIDRVSGMYRLPDELLLTVFYFIPPDINDLLAITHACRRWRLIATGTASLWTNVKLQIHPVLDPQDCVISTSLLEMQLERTGDLLLDVVWLGHIRDYINTSVLTLIHERASFSRWRTLELGLVGNPVSERAIFRPTDIFTNLESLVIVRNTFYHLFQNICQRTTEKFHMFDVGSGKNTPEGLVELYPHAMGHITRLVADAFYYGDEISILPPNITELKTSSRLSHPFPYISTYELDLCVFQCYHIIDLQNLGSLIITSQLLVYIDCHVILPSLRHLSYPALKIYDGAKFEIPRLEILVITTGQSDNKDIAQRRKWEHDVLNHPGYLISPRRSLIVELCLPAEVLILLLDKSPDVENAQLFFSDETCARMTVEEVLMGLSTGGLDKRPRNWLCPHLSELRMNFEWEVRNLAQWKQLSSNLVELRQKNGVILSIYASWKGEGTYVALA